MIIDPNAMDDTPIKVRLAASVIGVKTAYLQRAIRKDFVRASRDEDGSYRVKLIDVATAVWGSRKVADLPSPKSMLYHLNLVEAAGDTQSAFKAKEYLIVPCAVMYLRLPVGIIRGAISRGEIAYYTPFGDTVLLLVADLDE